MEKKIRHRSFEWNQPDENKLLEKAASSAARLSELSTGQMILNVGPQHPSTHGVLRLEVVTDGELVLEVVPHIGYLHRCFEKHAEALTFPQIIPYVDRMDYLAAMNSEHVFVMGVERMLGIEKNLHPRTEYIRVLVCELNRIASHLVAIGTYGMDIGAVTPFLWCFRDRGHIQNLLEWASGSRMLYNYIWVGGLFFDLPPGFEERCREFVSYFRPKLDELNEILTTNRIFIQRSAGIGVLPLELAIAYGCSGPMLRGSGLKWDLRRSDGYSAYPELEFTIPSGKGEMGQVGDCWDRHWVRAQEISQSLHIIEQCLDKLTGEHRRTNDYDPRQACPRKARPREGEYYVRGETPRGELGYYIIVDGKSEVPYRCKGRSPAFSNLSVLPEISRGVLLADLIAILGSVDIVLGEIDR